LILEITFDGGEKMKDWEKKFESLVKKRYFRESRLAEAERLALDHIEEGEVARIAYLKSLLSQGKSAEVVAAGNKWLSTDKNITYNIASFVCLAHFHMGNTSEGLSFLNLLISGDPLWSFHSLRSVVAFWTALMPISASSAQEVITSPKASDNEKRSAKILLDQIETIFSDAVGPQFKIAAVQTIKKIGHVYLKFAFSFIARLSLSDLEESSRDFWRQTRTIFNNKKTTIIENLANFDADSRKKAKKYLKKCSRSLNKMGYPGYFYKFKKHYGIVLAVGIILLLISNLVFTPVRSVFFSFMPNSLLIIFFVLGTLLVILMEHVLSDFWNRALERFLQKRFEKKLKAWISEFIKSWTCVEGLNLYHIVRMRNVDTMRILEDDWKDHENKMNAASNVLLEMSETTVSE